MTDPRTAALAEALVNTEMIQRYRAYALKANPGTMASESMWQLACEWAAAILAALPPDWCGHDPDDAERTALYLHTMNNMNTEIASHRECVESIRVLVADAERAAQIERDNAANLYESVVEQESTIARLRRIEEAARKMETWAHSEGYRVHREEWEDALRAALEEDR